MVDYKVFYSLWTICVLAQCCMCNDSWCSSISDIRNVSMIIGLLIENVDRIVLPLALFSLVASMFSNWFWRLLTFLVAWSLKFALLPFLPSTYFSAFTLWAMMHTTPIFGGFFGIRQPMKLEKNVHAVFITGCDSGMGYWTALYLAQLGCHVYAGCFNVKESEKKLHEDCIKPVAPPGEQGPIPMERMDTKEVLQKRIKCIDLDVTDDQKVKQAAATVSKALEGTKQKLIGIINCAGLGFNGPAEYFPIELYEKQMQVNCFGYIRVIQAFMPMLKKASSKDRRGRIVCIGTGGGVLTPSPPLLAAYMASKFAVEAFVASLRFDLQLTNQHIDAVMLNPGFVKPTMLPVVGLTLTEKMFEACKEKWGDDRARDQYGTLLQTFIDYTAKEKGTHVSKVAHVMAQIMTEHRPNACYKVGEDSKATPVVGLLPTYIKEFILKYSIYKQVGTT